MSNSIHYNITKRITYAVRMLFLKDMSLETFIINIDPLLYSLSLLIYSILSVC